MFKLFCKLGYGGHLRVRFIDILDTQLLLVVSFLASEPDGDGKRGRANEAEGTRVRGF